MRSVDINSSEKQWLLNYIHSTLTEFSEELWEIGDKYYCPYFVEHKVEAVKGNTVVQSHRDRKY